MFTNWLTNSVPITVASSTDVTNTNSSLADNSQSIPPPPAVSLAAATANNSASSLMSTPPDVILEVGPAPASVRFVAHSIVLGMHSGYLRSAIRLDEQVAAASTVGGSGARHSSADLVLYLSNVSAEQFAPLLTYMYTGYLDLNVENIFGVLLATHLLHMPRALEICRSFLARAQSEGYLSSNALPAPSVQNNGKIIRPIPSKATLPNFGFIAPPMTHHLASALPPAPAISFKPLPHTTSSSYQTNASMPPPLNENCAGQENLLSVTNSRNIENRRRGDIDDDDDDDDEEVFIDSYDESVAASPEIDCNISVTSSRDIEENEKEIVVVVTEESNASPARNAIAAPTTQHQTQKPKTPNVTKREKLRHSRHNHKQRRNKTASSSSLTSTGGLQVAKAPILASELVVDQERKVTATSAAATTAATAESSKVIIDVASCDGPVRFRRILNTAYGHKPPPESSSLLPLERTQQSVSLSFHQQMAKTISQQRQLQHAEESENSESSGSGGCGAPTASGSKSCSKTTTTNSNNEIYVCVYCKHSFKSQYCYQKHAKRHLNPLSLSCGNALESTSTCSGGDASSRSHNNKEVLRESAAILRQSQVVATTSTSAAYQTVLPPHVAHKQHAAAAAELLRREVRPLDMNVQYYPCKTCGSKFPSYYFVHKHRKLCHADEETQEAENRRSGSSANGGGATTHKKVP